MMSQRQDRSSRRGCSVYALDGVTRGFLDAMLTLLRDDTGLTTNGSYDVLCSMCSDSRVRAYLTRKLRSSKRRYGRVGCDRHTRLFDRSGSYRVYCRLASMRGNLVDYGDY